MKLSRPSRLLATCIALFSLLFMQLAVASYTCPGMRMGSDLDLAAMSADMDDPGMIGCIGMEKAQAGLCHAQSETVKQSLDKPQVPDIQPFVPAGLVLAVHTVEIASGSPVAPLASISLTRTTAPPIAIRNCCFRI